MTNLSQNWPHAKRNLWSSLLEDHDSEDLGLCMTKSNTSSGLNFPPSENDESHNQNDSELFDRLACAFH